MHDISHDMTLMKDERFKYILQSNLCQKRKKNMLIADVE